MKKIECVIREEKLSSLISSLRDIGIGGMTVTEVRGFGRERVMPEPYLQKKAKVEIFAQDWEVEGIIQTITVTCRSGRLGDGKIAVLSMDEVIRVRTLEKGEHALA